MTRYDAYVLRFWRSTGKDGLQWRGKLAHVGRGDSVQFSDVEALLQHIRHVAEYEDERGTGAGWVGGDRVSEL